MAWLKSYGAWIVAVALLAAFAVAGYSCSQERIAKLEQDRQVTRLTGEVQGLARQLDSAAKAERRDSLIYVTQWRTKYQILHDSVIRNIHDTVEVVRFVHVADSTILACQAVLTDCEQRAALLTRRVTIADSLTGLYKKGQPSFLQRHLGPVTLGALLAGFVLERVIVK